MLHYRTGLLGNSSEPRLVRVRKRSLKPGEADRTGVCEQRAYLRISVFFFLDSSQVFFLLSSRISYSHIATETPPPPRTSYESSLASSVLCAPAFQGGLTFRKQRNSCHFNPVTSQLLMSKYPGIRFPTAFLPVKKLRKHPYV